MIGLFEYLKETGTKTYAPIHCPSRETFSNYLQY